MLTPCPENETLLAYYLKDMPAPDRSITDAHLSSCNACLLRLLDFARTHVYLNRGADWAVPEALVSRVLSDRPARSAAASASSSLLKLVVRLARSSIQILKDSLMPESVSMNWIQGMSPATAFRSGDADAARQLRLDQSLADSHLSVQLNPVEGSRVDLEIQLGLPGQPESGVRILLKENGTILHSQKTDDAGKLVIAHIHPGQYRLQIPSRKIDWAIDIQPEEKAA